MSGTYVQVWPTPSMSLRDRVRARVAADEAAGVEYPPLSDFQADRLTTLMATKRAGQ